MFEVEIKARLSDPQATEARAAELGVFEKEVGKEDVYFRRRGETDPVPIPRYRLRREADQAIVTFKDRQVNGGVEINDEVEFQVDSPYAFYKFADYLGFEPFVVKRKRSRVYRIGAVRVELNEVEHLGHFVEIEMLCDDRATVLIARTQVARLLNQLGLPPDSPEPRSYIFMIQEAYPVRYRFIDDPTLEWPFEEVRT
ncbi:MAG TPA: class IV adenylate cyclase [Anaerolineae bacterium]|nr:class IV adenylate cyclase [Anaerolineae bacterium]HMR66451.1 class IV adenylate cyclase [Anaerolineae bacterium]